jgi:hypothetical protein
MTTIVVKWLRKNTFRVHLVAFLLMIIPPALLYLAAETGATGAIWLLLAMVITGNILVILAR